MPKVRVVSEFMRQDLVTLGPETLIVEGIVKLMEHSISGAPVTDPNGRYLGMFSEKCCLNALAPAMEELERQGVAMHKAPQFMAKKIMVLRPEADVFESIDQLLAKKVSGAPVLDSKDQFRGSFSEKTAMRVLINSAYDQIPGGLVGSYMNPDPKRIIDEETSLLEAASTFRTTPFRRLPVLRGTALLGQVSRRDVLREQFALTQGLNGRLQLGTVVRHMDIMARTIRPDDDLLTLAQIFHDTPYRRLPVLDGDHLVGQVSRRDLLRLAADLVRPEPEHPKAQVLYLSPLLDSAPPQVL